MNGGITMSKSIKVSEKYGLNPSICKCFFCGADKGIALLGQIGDRRKHEDIEAPRECIMDYEPCDECANNMKQGVTLIEVSDTQPEDKRPPLKAQGDQEVYPLGHWLVVKPEAFSRMTNQEWSAGQKCFIDTQVYNMLTSNN